MPARLLGALSLAVAGVLYYATWWQADPEIYLRLVTKTPVAVDVDIEEAAAQIFNIRTPTGPAADKAPPPRAVSADPEFPAARWNARTTQIAIPVAAYTWLTTSTGSFLLLAMTGGALVLAGSPWRAIGVLLAVASILCIGAGTYYVYATFGTYRPTDLRYGIGLVVLMAIGSGSIMGRQGGKLARTASLSLILAAVVTAVGLYVWGQCGALKVEHFTFAFIAGAFAIHAAWGAVLFPLAKRT